MGRNISTEIWSIFQFRNTEGTVHSFDEFDASEGKVDFSENCLFFASNQSAL